MINSADKALLYTTLILLFGGLLILASASVVISQTNFNSLTHYTLRQLTYGGIFGFLGFIAGFMVPYRLWRRLALPLIIISFVLLTLLFIPSLGYSSGGARRWLHLGFISFQPAEILKFAFIVYLASWLDARRRLVGSLSYGLIPFALMLSLVGIFLIMQPDIGTLGVIVLTSLILYFLGGGRVSQMVTLSFFGAMLLYFLVQLAPYRLSRILVFLNPGTDPQGLGYQISQAFIAIGSGGFFGAGFGKGLQKYNYLPEPMGDSVFAIASEELGFVGAVLIILVFAFFFWRGIVIARNAPDMFGKLLAAGISISIMTQAFVNMAAISGLLPLTGIPLPFVSYGGTSLAMTLMGVGVLLNISKKA